MELFFKTAGKGKTVILLHGLFGSGDNLGMIARPLAEHYQVISIDLRNHGRSPHSATMDYPSMATDLLQFIETKQVKPYAILGHSMGGKVAMQFALNFSEHIEKLIVADIAPVFYKPHHDEILQALQQLLNARCSSRKDADQCLSQYIDDIGTRQFLLTNLIRQSDGEFGLRLNLPAIQSNQLALCAAPTGDTFGKPSCFIRGACSDYVNEAGIGVINTLFPSNRLITIPEVGHWLHAEQPQFFSNAVLSFLSEEI